MAKRIKFTAKVKRGLVIMSQLNVDAANDRKPPIATILASMRASDTSDYNAARAFVEQCEQELINVREAAIRRRGETKHTACFQDGRDGSTCGRVNNTLTRDRSQVGCAECLARIDEGGEPIPPMPAAPETPRCGELVDALA